MAFAGGFLDRGFAILRHSGKMPPCRRPIPPHFDPAFRTGAGFLWRLPFSASFTEHCRSGFRTTESSRSFRKSKAGEVGSKRGRLV